MLLQLREEIELQACAQQVWALVEDFGGIDRWAVGVEVRGCGPGAVRVLRSGRHELHEALELLDPAKMLLRYRMLRGPIPAQGYVSTIQVSRSACAK